MKRFYANDMNITDCVEGMAQFSIKDKELIIGIFLHLYSIDVHGGQDIITSIEIISCTILS